MYLGVDGGGTKTAFVLIDRQGHIISYLRKNSCHYIQVGFNGFKKVLEQGIKELCHKSGIKISEIKYAFFGIPAYGEIKKAETKLESLIEEIMCGGSFSCGNDVEAGWAGSLACLPGINIVGGTGAIGFGKDEDGASARVSGWGYFCGDEGSAYWMGKQLISLFTKQSDGRLEKSPLYEITKSALKLERDLDLIKLIYEDYKFKREKIAALAVYLYQSAKQNDQYAIQIYQEAAYEFSLIVKALDDSLNFLKNNQPIPVSYSGGVFKAGNYILSPLNSYLQEEKFNLVKPILEPVLGSAFYALLIKEGYENYKQQLNNLKKDQLAFF